MAKRRRRLSGGTTPATPTETTGQALTSTGEVGKKYGQETVQKALKNPHGTNAFFACLFVCVIPLLIYAWIGKSTNVLANEIMLSFMSMSMAASGVAYFLLQEDTTDYFVKGFIGIAVFSFIAWIYFAYHIYDPYTDEDNDTD